MTELKTLKDMYKWDIGVKGIVSVEYLRQEAIKHGKMLRDVGEWRTLSWVKQFFNITEKDLK